jgi:hypothetical protein
LRSFGYGPSENREFSRPPETDQARAPSGAQTENTEDQNEDTKEEYDAKDRGVDLSRHRRVLVGSTAIDINPTKLLPRIVFSPFNEPWENECLEKTLGQICDAKSLKVQCRTSRHMTPPPQHSKVIASLKSEYEWRLV